LRPQHSALLFCLVPSGSQVYWVTGRLRTLGCHVSLDSHVPFGTLRLKWVVRRSPQVVKSRKTRPHPKLSHREAFTSSKRNPDKKSSSRVTSIITLRGDSCDPLYFVRNLDRDCPGQRGVHIKSSLRWIDSFKTPNGGLNLPYIDKLGRFTGHTLYKWSCDPRSLIATSVATVADRIIAYARRHNKNRVVHRFSKSLLGAAAYYVFTKNSHFWDRILFFCRNLEKRGNLVHRLRLFFSSKWDDHKRFVFSQVIFQTNWLLSRALGPRDKSLFFEGRKRTIWSNPDSAPSRLRITECIREIAYAISNMCSF